MIVLASSDMAEVLCERLLAVFLKPVEQFVQSHLGTTGMAAPFATLAAGIIGIALGKLIWAAIKKFDLPVPSVWEKVDPNDSILVENMFKKPEIVRGVAAATSASRATTIEEFREQVRELHTRSSVLSTTT